MDMERLEQYVERCPLHQLEYRNAAGVYTLGYSPTKPAWWTVSFAPGWQSAPSTFQVRGLHTLLKVTERVYPEFYAWLLERFPSDEVM